MVIKAKNLFVYECWAVHRTGHGDKGVARCGVLDYTEE